VDTKGESSVVVDLGANRTLGSGVAEIVTVDSADVVLVQNEIPLDASRAFAAGARRAGATVILNASPFTAACIQDIESDDYLIFNEVEFSQYLGIPVGSMMVEDIEAALAHQAGADMPNLIVTVGGKGVRARTKAHLHIVPGHIVTVVDTTGAGDCFCGSFAAALAAGIDPDHCLAFANAAAAISVQSLGAGPSMPSYQQTVAFLALRS
jgi:ribokinase